MSESPNISGAEAITRMLKDAGVEYAFAYPGTSELELCEEIDRSPINLVNSRGDKEAISLSAGSHLLGTRKAVAILHGARGSMNALGSIGIAQRNEISCPIIIGTPSSSSAPFLPPHGEDALVERIGSFTKNLVPPMEKIPSAEGIDQAGTEFVSQFREVLSSAYSLPYGPACFGLPQDIAESKWIPREKMEVSDETSNSKIDVKAIEDACERIRNARNIVILADDFALKHEGMKQALDSLHSKTGIQMMQLDYLRGPMLFQRPNKDDSHWFMGMYSPTEERTETLQETDLLITLEDRNCYERVAGKLPNCPKIGITSNPKATNKNNYLTTNDLLISGDPVEIVTQIAKRLSLESTQVSSNFLARMKSLLQADDISAPEKFDHFRTHLPRVLADALNSCDRPVLIDDSQMFGGLLALNYEQLPKKLKVVGDHSAFVGGGLAIASGLALTEPNAQVMVTLGDQGYTNSTQALAVVSENNIPINIVVCNNGRSVSLTKQINSQRQQSTLGTNGSILDNPSNLSYANIAQGFGIRSHKFYLDGLSKDEYDKELVRLEQWLKEGFTKKMPQLAEIICPSDPEAWAGIWRTKGNEK